LSLPGMPLEMTDQVFRPGVLLIGPRPMRLPARSFRVFSSGSTAIMAFTFSA